MSTRTVVVDGQVLAVPDGADWERLLETGKFEDARIPFPGRINGALDFVSQRAEKFSLALLRLETTAFGTYMGRLYLFRHEDEWFRVRILDVQCRTCGCGVWAADVNDEELFRGAVDEAAAMARAKTLARVMCPKCGGEMDPRVYGIWAEQKA